MARTTGRRDPRTMHPYFADRMAEVEAAIQQQELQTAIEEEATEHAIGHLFGWC